MRGNVAVGGELLISLDEWPSPFVYAGGGIGKHTQATGASADTGFVLGV